jgi:hypothetical protein
MKRFIALASQWSHRLMSNFDYFDLSILSANNIQPLKDFVKQFREANGDRVFKVIWKDPSFQVQVNITKENPLLKSGIAGVHDFNIRTGGHRIIIQNYGKREYEYHRGGIPGTLFHEWCHIVQSYNAHHGLGKWFYNSCHPQQDVLYKRYQHMCSGFYAGFSPEEMAAEAFRVLNGFRSSESWEENKNFLADWKDFFTSDEVFALHFNSRSKS